MSRIIPFERFEQGIKYNVKKQKKALYKRILFITLGASLAAFGLEMFLTPNQIIPGGVTGFSSLLSHMTEMRMGVFLFFLNLPFILHHINIVSRARALWAVLGLVLLTILIILFHPFPPLIEYPPLAAFFGSLMFGCGVGIIFRYAGFIDGVHQAASLLKKRVPITITKIILLINILILGLAGFIFGWAQAVYSIFGYVITLKSSEYTMKKFCIQKMVLIQTERPLTLKHALKTKFGKQFEYLTQSFPYHSSDKIFIIIPSRQEKSVRKLVAEFEPSATLAVAPLDPLFTE